MEPLYNLPFLRWFPKKYAILILKLLGYKNYYIGEYKNYWQLIKMFKKFEVIDYTIKVIKNPKRFNFVKLVKFEKIINILPNFVLNIIYPFSPTFIFILKKSK